MRRNYAIVWILNFTFLRALFILVAHSNLFQTVSVLFSYPTTLCLCFPITYYLVFQCYLVCENYLSPPIQLFKGKQKKSSNNALYFDLFLFSAKYLLLFLKDVFNKSIFFLFSQYFWMLIWIILSPFIFGTISSCW